MAFQVRLLTLDDMEEAAKVHRKSFDERLPSLAGLHTPQEDRVFFKSHLFNECEMWGAVDGRLVGFIAFSNGWIDQLYVLPDWQGQGIGKALLDIAKGRCPKLRLWTFQQNKPARQFYERNGFVPIEETDGHDNEEKAPDVLYEWPVETLSP
jgi:putative acetyltransferase